MLKQQLRANLKEALTSRKQEVVSVLRMVQSAILTKEKEKRAKLAKDNPDWPSSKLEEESSLTDEEIVGVLSAEAKKRKESVDAFLGGGRQDLAEKETSELEIINKYLPEQLSEDEIRRLVREAIQKTEAGGPKDMGKVMAELMPKVKGRTEGGLVSRMVKETLTNDRQSITDND